MEMETIEIKAFVPARDFALSRRFYTDLGFHEDLLSEQMAYFKAGSAASCCRSSTCRRTATTS